MLNISFTPQEERIISLLETKSRKAIQRTASPFGKPYDYRPRGDLCKRLSRVTGLTHEQVYDQLREIHRKIKATNGEAIL